MDLLSTYNPFLHPAFQRNVIDTSDVLVHPHTAEDELPGLHFLGVLNKNLELK